MKRFFKILFLTVLALFVLMQLYPKPVKNIDASANLNDIAVTNNTPGDVQNILKKSCYDCHSNNTVYPWYSKIQPVAWWLGSHISDGKKALNFSIFGTYTIRRKYKKLDDIIKEVDQGDMPLSSYTLIHTDAKLDASKKAVLLAWAKAEHEGMKAHYPADSLTVKK